MDDDFNQVHAAQGDHLWLFDTAGGMEVAQRRTLAGGVVDEVDTDDDLSYDVSIDALAYDGSGVLWIFGESDADDVYRFLRIDATEEPDVLLNTYEFDLALRAAASDGTHVWVIVNESPYEVLELDPADFAVVATYSAPDRTTSWRGIASVGEHLVLLGTDYLDRGVLVEVQP
jgi:hypothetical protein